MNITPKGIIFDFNGTIVDDYELQKDVWSQLSQEVRGKPVTDEEMINHIRGLSNRDIVTWLTADTPNANQIEELAKRKTAMTIAAFTQSTSLHLLPGLAQLLNDLAARDTSRTIATSQSPELFRPLFDKFKLGAWFDFDTVVCFDGTYPGKPAPDAYVLAARKLGLQPRDCVVVEDAHSGITAAAAAGVTRIIVVNRDDARLAEFSRLPGVIKTMHDFTGFKLDELVA